MTEIKSWQDRFVGQYKTDDLPNLLLTYMLAEIAELRAALAESRPVEQGEPVAWINKDHTYVQLSDKATVYGSHTIPLFTHPVRPMSQAEAEALAHRRASKYAHRSEPEYIAYTFLPHTLMDFVRDVEAHIKGATE